MHPLSDREDTHAPAVRQRGHPCTRCQTERTPMHPLSDREDTQFLNDTREGDSWSHWMPRPKISWVSVRRVYGVQIKYVPSSQSPTVNQDGFHCINCWEVWERCMPLNIKKVSPHAIYRGSLWESVPWSQVSPYRSVPWRQVLLNEK